MQCVLIQHSTTIGLRNNFVHYILCKYNIHKTYPGSSKLNLCRCTAEQRRYMTQHYNVQNEKTPLYKQANTYIRQYLTLRITPVNFNTFDGVW